MNDWRLYLICFVLALAFGFVICIALDLGHSESYRIQVEKLGILIQATNGGKH